ncbi:MAG: PD-(D/E)XK nuclease family transposase, partial [Clostridium sp.]
KEEILNYIHERYLDSNGENVLSGNTEDESIPGAKIVYDILFEVKIPGRESESIIINVEAQSTDQLPYDLVRRGIYYAARLINRQKNSSEGFQNSDFNSLKKVYSIWICMNHTNEKNHIIKHYRITEEEGVGYKNPKESYDLMDVVMVYVNKNYDYDEDDRSLDRLLHIVLGKHLTAQEKIEQLRKYYDILISEEEEKEVNEMCNLSLGLRMEAMQEGLAKGLAEGELKSTIQYVKNMMKKMPEMSIEEAMDILGVEENLREQVVEAIQ